MPNEINGLKVPFVPIVQKDRIDGSKFKESSNRFDSLFQTELEKLKFSSHASKRLEARNITLSENEIVKLEDAVGKAEAKGSKDSLVMMDSTAFIVNVPNKTVVTAINVNESKDNVFTNIDSVVFAN